jgi:hypothetical protein
MGIRCMFGFHAWGVAEYSDKTNTIYSLRLGGGAHTTHTYTKTRKCVECGTTNLQVVPDSEYYTWRKSK